ncbi:MAG: ArsA-related P-loop ATPase, partial [Solirubrobacteraceae bacterium]
MALLGEGDGEVQRCRGLGDAALLVGERDHLRSRTHHAPVFVRTRENPSWPVCSTAVPGPLDHRLLFVTGKGGVGKSTVATALGMLAARQGLRTIV